MKIEDLTICPALFSCYIAKKMKGGKMSQERKALTKEDMKNVIAWYAMNELESGKSLELRLNDGSLVTLSYQEK
jgi:cytochrome c553